MPITSKKKLRTRYNELNQKSTDELLSIYSGEMTELTFEAIQKILSVRNVKIPDKHGPVSEDQSMTHIITLDDLANVKTEETKFEGMGWIEGISFVSGIIVIFFTMRYSILLSIVCGVVTSALFFVGMRFLRKTWREIGLKNGKTLDDI